MTTLRTAFVCALASLPAGFVAGWFGANTQPSPITLTALPVAPVANAPDRDLAVRLTDTADTTDLGSAIAALRERAQAAEKALGDLQVRLAAATTPSPAGTHRTGPIGDDEIERFQQLERTVARVRQVRAGHARARLSVERILLDAQLAPHVTNAVDGVIDQYLTDAQRFALVDRNALDDLGRRGLEQQQQDLRDRTLVGLQAHVPGPVARAVVDQLTQGGAPGAAVSGSGFQPLDPKAIDLAGSNFVPGVGRKVAR